MDVGGYRPQTDLDRLGGDSAGAHLNRLMDRLGFDERLGDLMGMQLDKAIGDNLGVARNMLDLFSPLSTSQLDRMMGGGFAPPGFVPRPRDDYGNHWANTKPTYYDPEKIHVYKEPNLMGLFGKKDVMIDGKKIDVGNDWGVTPKQLETKIMTDPAFRQKIEDQLGYKIKLDGNADGNIELRKPLHHPMMPYHNQVNHHIGNFLGRLLGPMLGGGPLGGGPLGGGPLGGGPLGGGPLGGGPLGLPGGPMGQVFDQMAKFLGGGFGGPGQASGAPGGTQGTQPGSPNADTKELLDILDDPNLSFETKLSLFMGKFIEKKQKDMLAKTRELTQNQDQTKGGAGAAGGGGGGGPLGALGGLFGGGGGGGPLGAIGSLFGGGGGGGGLGGLFPVGGAVLGGMVGGPFGASLGSSIAGSLGQSVAGGAGGAGGAGQAGEAGAGKKSDQEIQTELTAITQAFQRLVKGLEGVMDSVHELGKGTASRIRP